MARKCLYLFVIVVMCVVVAFINSTVFRPFTFSVQAVKDSRPFHFLIPDRPMEKEDPRFDATFPSTRAATPNVAEIEILFEASPEKEGTNSRNLSKTAREKTTLSTATSEMESTSPMYSTSQTHSTSTPDDVKDNVLSETGKTASTVTTSEGEWLSTSSFSTASTPSSQNVGYVLGETEENSTALISEEMQMPQSTTTLETTSAFETQGVPEATPSTPSAQTTTTTEGIILDGTHANVTKGNKTSDESEDGIKGKTNRTSDALPVLSDRVHINGSTPQVNVFNESVDVSSGNFGPVNDTIRNLTNDLQVAGQGIQIGTNELPEPGDNNGTSEDVGIRDNWQGNITNEAFNKSTTLNVNEDSETFDDVKQNVTNDKELDGAVFKNLTSGFETLDDGIQNVTNYAKNNSAVLHNVTSYNETFDGVEQNVSNTTKLDNVAFKNLTNGIDVKQNATVEGFTMEDFADEVGPVNGTEDISVNGYEATDATKHNVTNEQ